MLLNERLRLSQPPAHGEIGRALQDRLLPARQLAARERARLAGVVRGVALGGEVLGVAAVGGGGHVGRLSLVSLLDVIIHYTATMSIVSFGY